MQQWCLGWLTSRCMKGLGYAISVAGFFLYNYIKMQRSPAPRNLAPLKHGDYAVLMQTDAEAQKGRM